MEELFILPEPGREKDPAVLITTIFAGVAVVLFFVVLIVVIVKVRKSLKRTFMSMSVIREFRNISKLFFNQDLMLPGS